MTLNVRRLVRKARLQSLASPHRKRGELRPVLAILPLKLSVETGVMRRTVQHQHRVIKPNPEAKLKLPQKESMMAH